ncbi:30S ribosomal protein S6 [Natroniella sulfidigena]|uniref:30S ribosomal protein S6 n=1 Tax=Natroniella sulfidigena TaxID=723921 RepID=UPI00200A86D8|nr:30S ribosomal protein S6 [Natroniella sulfidigena]MCK8816642.1 30S ribosomal protein S6 [Natroniella sulfidigena]
MTKYETMLIISPDLDEETTEATVEKVTSVIEDSEGEVLKLDKWGTKELAYEINDQSAGYYTVVNFTAEPATLDELERIYRIDDNIMRYLILKDE